MWVRRQRGLSDEASEASEEEDVRELTGSARMRKVKPFKKWRPTQI